MAGVTAGAGATTRGGVPVEAGVTSEAMAGPGATARTVTFITPPFPKLWGSSGENYNYQQSSPL